MDNNHSEQEKGYKIFYEPVSPKLKALLLSDVDQMAWVTIGDYEIHLEYEDLSPEMQEKARIELRETPEIVDDAKAKLRSLLKLEENLITPYENDAWLVRFLRPCKYYPYSALELIKKYYKFKVAHSEIYKGLKPSNEKNVFQQNVFQFQQERDQCGRRLLTIKLGREWKPNKVTLDEMFKGVILLLEISLLEPQTQVCGVVIILDFDGLSFFQTTKFTPMFLKRLLDWMQESIPIRIKNVHVVNQSYLFNLVYNLTKPFLREKLKKRLLFHGRNYKTLHQFIHPEYVLPVYGGTLKVPEDYDINIWLEVLVLCDKEFEKLNSYGYKKVKG